LVRVTTSTNRNANRKN